MPDRVRAVFRYRQGQIDMLTRLRRYHDQYGPVVMQRWGPWTVVNLYGPDANRLVLTDPDGIFTARQPWDVVMGKIFRNGLLLRDGDDHKRHRGIMRHAFSRSTLVDYVARMNPIVEGAVASWRQQEEAFLVYPAMKQLSLSLATRLFIGAELEEESRRIDEIFSELVAASMARVRLRIPGLQFNRSVKGRKWMADRLTRLIPERRSGDGSDLFSILCRARSEQGEQFTDEEIVDHMVFLMMAAHDTVTSAMTSMMYELAANPGWQDRIRDEGDAVGGRPIGFADLDRLERLGWVIRETLRRYPPLAVIPRFATKDFECHGYVVPRGTIVVISPIHTHHMSAWWGDPFRFDPDRFSPERAEHQRHSHSWIPFGGGRHLCLGLQFAELLMKVVMHHVVRRHRWSVPEGYRMPVQQAPISKPRDGLPVMLGAV